MGQSKGLSFYGILVKDPLSFFSFGSWNNWSIFILAPIATS